MPDNTHHTMLCSVETTNITITTTEAINILDQSLSAIRGVCRALPTRLLAREARERMLAAHRVIENEIENICGRM